MSQQKQKEMARKQVLDNLGEDLKKKDKDSWDKLDEIRYKVERQLVKNWVVFAIAFLIIVSIGVRELNQTKQAMAQMSKSLDTQSQSAIGLDNGMVVDIKRDLIKPKDNQYYIANALLNLIVSRAEISKKFTQTKIDTPSQIIENSTKLGDFFNEFIIINQKEGNPEYITFEKNGIGYYKAYLETLMQFFREDKLPHIIDVLNYRIPRDGFVMEGKKFKIVVEVPVAITVFSANKENSVTKEKGAWNVKEGMVVIQAKGLLDIKTRTKEDPTVQTKGLNGLGIHFDWFTVTYPDIKDMK